METLIINIITDRVTLHTNMTWATQTKTLKKVKTTTTLTKDIHTTISAKTDTQSNLKRRNIKEKCHLQRLKPPKTNLKTYFAILVNTLSNQSMLTRLILNIAHLALIDTNIDIASEMGSLTDIEHQNEPDIVRGELTSEVMAIDSALIKPFLTIC